MLPITLKPTLVQRCLFILVKKGFLQRFQNWYRYK